MTTRNVAGDKQISEYLEAALFVAEVSGLAEDFRRYAVRAASADLDERTRYLLSALDHLIEARTALQKYCLRGGSGLSPPPPRGPL